MIPTFAKSADFTDFEKPWTSKTADFKKNHGFRKLQILKTTDFEKLHSESTKNRGFLCETKDKVCLER